MEHTKKISDHYEGINLVEHQIEINRSNYESYLKSMSTRLNIILAIPVLVLTVVLILAIL